jgi:RNA ligase (TIGR02306 family)
MNSTHCVEVFAVEKVRPHPNADRLELLEFQGYQTVVKKGEHRPGALAAFIPPDNLVDVTRPEFAFLAPQARADGKARIKAIRLRGEPSFGLVVPAPPGASPGDNVAVALGVEHYVPFIEGAGKANKARLYMGGECTSPPDVPHVKYDLEAGRRYARLLFQPGEPVVVTEKIHGASGRYVFWNDRMYCGSRGEWKKEYPSYDHVTVEALEPRVGREKAEEIVEKLRSGPKTKNLWWKALDNTPAVRCFCEQNPGVLVYGEVFGSVQDMRYGHAPGAVSFAAFDMMYDGKWMDTEEFFANCDDWDIPTVPRVARGRVEFDFDTICDMAEGPSLYPGADHIREGVVVKPIHERTHPRLGRVALKWVGVGYLSRRDTDEPSSSEDK